jgi:hypothetical protein
VREKACNYIKSLYHHQRHVPSVSCTIDCLLLCIDCHFNFKSRLVHLFCLEPPSLVRQGRHLPLRRKETRITVPPISPLLLLTRSPTLSQRHQLQGVLPVIPQLLLYHLITPFRSVLSGSIASSSAKSTKHSAADTKYAPDIPHRTTNHPPPPAT